MYHDEQAGIAYIYRLHTSTWYLLTLNTPTQTLTLALTLTLTPNPNPNLERPLLSPPFPIGRLKGQRG